MATRKTDTTTSSRKRESTFDPDKFLDAYDEGCREVDALLYAARKQAASSAPCKKTASRTKKKLTSAATLDDKTIIAVDTTVSDSTAEADNATKTVEAVEPIAPATTDKVIEPTIMAKTAKTDIPISTTITSMADKVTEAMPDVTVDEQSARLPKPTRISGRMRRASRDEFCGTYTRKVDTKGGSPITIAPDILKMAHVICAKSGNYKSCPTYVINNILRAVFEDMTDEIKSWPMPE